MNKISYKQAQELKAAGFPQGNNLIASDGLAFSSHGYGWQGEYAHLPTLSELIEECGDDFFNLNAVGIGKHRKWQCNFTGNNVNSLEDEWESEGSTPEEAVANLYLKLKKK